MKKEVELKKRGEMKKGGMSRNFVVALSVVSIIGFMSIIIESFFNYSINSYIETLWLLALGMGLILETSIRELKQIKKIGLSSEKLGKVTMLIVGSLAIIAAIFSLPQINLQQPTFLAIKGIISSIAVIFIVIQTWIIRS